MSNCMNFETKDEFMKYYEEHKNEIDKLATKDLNKMYKINSHKLSRNKNKIIVRTLTSETSSNLPKSKDNNKDDKSKPNENKEIKPADLNKMIDSLINHYEKQILQLREMKKKLFLKSYLIPTIMNK